MCQWSKQIYRNIRFIQYKLKPKVVFVITFWLVIYPTYQHWHITLFWVKVATCYTAHWDWKSLHTSQLVYLQELFPMQYFKIYTCISVEEQIFVKRPPNYSPSCMFNYTWCQWLWNITYLIYHTNSIIF